MKTLILKLTILLSIQFLSLSLFSQSPPEAINYQAVARNLGGVPLVNQSITVDFSIRQGSSTGTVVYSESHSTTTNQFGLFTSEVGLGTVISGTFSGINWGSSTYYLEVSVNGDVMPATQLLSVPYALHAKTAATGVPGANGHNSLISSTPEPAGTNCANGGYFIQSWLDLDDDGALSAGETPISYYVCNGEDGTNGLDGNDGVGITSTVDNGNGTFTINYSDGTNFTTSDLTGPAGTNGATYYSGNGVVISNDSIINTGDLSSSNEIQTLSLNTTQDSLFISDGNGVPLSFSGDSDWTQGTGVTYNTTDNIGIGNSTPTALLDVSGLTKTDSLRVLAGAGNAGDVLTSDAAGNATWQLPSSGKLIEDGDADTKILVDSNNTDDDVIHFINNGTENVRIIDGRLEFVNNGHSVFIGEEAGMNDNHTGNNVFIGALAGTNNTNGSANVALGHTSMQGNISGSSNVAVGLSSLYNNTTGTTNAVLGDAVMYNNTTGSGNVAIGYEAGFSNTLGQNNVFIGNQAGRSELGSNKLYIDNSSTSTPLIWGDFINDLLRVNGALNINNAYTLPTTDGSTSGDVLATDAAGNVSWQTPSAGADNWGNDTVNVSGLNIAGSGTVANPLRVIDNDTSATNELELPMTGNNMGDVLKWNGSSWVSGAETSDSDWTSGTGTIYNTNDSIGIGTNSPEALLHITRYSTPQLKIGNDNQPSYEWSFDVDPVANMTIRNEGNGTPMDFIYLNSSNNNIGIGTNNPTARLHHEGTLRLNNLGSAFNTGYVLTATSTNGDAEWKPLPTSPTTYWSSTNTGSIHPSTIGDYVGIGTINPNTDLEVMGSVRIANFASATNIPHHSLLVAQNVGVTDGTDGAFVDIQNWFGSSTSTSPTMSGLRFKSVALSGDEHYKGAIMFRRNTTNGRGDIVFANNNGDNASNVTYADAAMVISSDRNVGIGTNSPTARLHHEGTLRLNNLGSAFNTGYVLTATSTNGDAEWQPLPAAPTTYWTTTNTGSIHPTNLNHKIGIGTDNPVEMVEIKSQDSDIEVETSDIAESSSIHLKRSKGTPSSPTLFTGSVAEIFGSIDFQGYLGSSYRSGAAIRGHLDGVSSGTNMPGALAFYTNTGASASPSERMRISSSGNVGIGTTTPGAKLHIEGGTLKISGSGEDMNLYQTGSTSRIQTDNPFEISANGGGGVGFEMDEVEAYFNIQTHIDVATNTTPMLDLNNSNSTGDISMAFKGITNNYTIGIDGSDDKFKISNASALGTNDRLAINTIGNVGIGTTTPGAKLDVAGNVQANNFVYTTPKIFHYSVGAGNFRPGGDFTNGFSTVVGNGHSFLTSGWGYIVADVHLPDNAKITGVKIYYEDEASSADMTVYFREYSLTGSGANAFHTFTSSGSSTGTQAYTNTSLNHTINNQLNSYYIGVVATWPSQNTGDKLSIRGIVITYEMSSTH